MISLFNGKALALNGFTSYSNGYLQVIPEKYNQYLPLNIPEILPQRV
jgi:hypothetical protein